ncbi:MAG: 2-hydroxyacid dehydrogenase [Thermomicrobiales bacterium]
MPIVAVTRGIPEAGLALLRAAADVRVWPDELPPSPAELATLLHGCDGALTMSTDRIAGDLLDREPQLRVISNFAVGLDNVDVAAATARGVAVCNTPGVLTETTADAAFALLMASGRRLNEGVDYVKAGHWRAWIPMLLLGQDLYQATLGIVGFGRIGQAVARRARGFDMRILYYSNTRRPDAERDLGAEYRPFDDLLREADFVSLHVALTPQTRHLMSARELGLMKPGAVLVNTARGPVVDTDALVQALRAGEIGGAALDVTDPEPLPADHPLLGFPNAIVVPHIASASHATRDRMADLSARNLLAVLRGERPPSIVNPEVLG